MYICFVLNVHLVRKTHLRPYNYSLKTEILAGI